MSDRLVSEAVGRAATSLQLAGTDHLLEKDLKSAVQAALRELVEERQLGLTVSTDEHSLDMAGFQGVGKVDVAVYDTSEKPAALLELKWGYGTLLQVSWDVVKLALAHRMGETRQAFVVAGAPSERWASERGRELFEFRHRDTGDLLLIYQDLFDWSRGQVNCRPTRLPAEIVTRPCGRASLVIGEHEWEIRAAEVRSAGDWSVNIEEGREAGRDRRDRFVSSDADIEWRPRPEAAEGIDETGSDVGFHADFSGEEHRDT